MIMYHDQDLVQQDRDQGLGPNLDHDQDHAPDLNLLLDRGKLIEFKFIDRICLYQDREARAMRTN